MKQKGGDRRGSKTSRINRLIDLRHARSSGFRKRVAGAQNIIHDALVTLKRPYVSFSGGKDSLVILHMIMKELPDIPVLYVDQGMEYPDTYDYIRKMWIEWDLDLTWEDPEMDLWDLYKQGGFLNPDVPTDPEIRAKFSNTVFYDPIKLFSDRIRADGFFMGLRADESHDRKLNFLKRGFMYKKADGLTAVQPIADWSVNDVWAYITSNGLPYNPIYDKNKFECRNSLRVAPFGLGGWHVSLGSYVFMKYYYPELWNRFCESNPLARKYV